METRLLDEARAIKNVSRSQYVLEAALERAHEDLRSYNRLLQGAIERGVLPLRPNRKLT